jgi:hypothetical protein
MITLPTFTVSEVLLICISLLLKGNGTIGFMAISEDNQPYEPFYHIPNVEEHIKHFLHLFCVYHFVIEGYVTNLLVSSCEENPEEVHISKTSRGNNFILDNLHTR